MAGLTDDQLLDAIKTSEATAIGPLSSDVATDRADAIDRYLGKPYGDEQIGRSQVVSRDVSDVVEGVLANVLKPFVAGDDVVKFNPRGPDDEEAAKQETDYVNFVVLERNNGFLVLNSAIKDLLLLRNGYVKCGWRVRQDIVLETYQGQSDDELAMLMQDKEIEVVQHTEYPDPMGMPMPGPDGQPQPAPNLHDVKVRRVRPTEYVEILPCPPDEVRVSQRSRGPSVADVDFVQHSTLKMLSELRELGYKVEDDIEDDDDATSNIEDFARDRFGSETFSRTSENTGDPSRRIVLFKESWIKIDYDGDGIAELRRVCSVGRNLLANEETDIVPLVGGTGVLMQHKHLGISVYDMIKDVAQIKTVLLRSYLDNRYLANNSEKVINVDAAPVMDDFLTSRPGGIKRVTGNPNEVVMPLAVPDTGDGALSALEYLDSVRESRTGYNKVNQALDSESLASNTAAGMAMQRDQSQIRLEMIARTVAETLVRDLFRTVHALTLKHARQAEIVRLRNKWVTVDPREWVKRTELSISVGLGSNQGQQQVQNLMMIGQAQQAAAQLGLATPDNFYETASRLVIAMGYKNPEAFFTPPQKKPKVDPQTGQPVMGPDGKPVMESAPPPQQPPPEVQVEQMRGQTQMQMKQMELQASGQQEQAQAQERANSELARAQADVAVQQHRTQSEMQRDIEKFKLQLQADDLRHQREQDTALKEANIKAAAQVEVARIGTGTDDGTVVLHEELKNAYGGIAADMVKAVQAMIQNVQADREIVRGPDGKAVGTRVKNGAMH